MSESKSWDGKTRGGVMGYKIFLFILRTFGFSFSYFILYFVAFYFCLFAPASTKASYFYFRTVRSYPFLKACRLVFKSYYIFGQTILDKVGILAGVPNDFTFYFDNETELRKLGAEDQAAVLVSAHIGNWEIAGHFLKKIEKPVNIVMFEGEHQQIKRLIADATVERKYKVIGVKEDFSHLFEIHRAIKQKEFICIHGDRYKKEHKNKTVRLNFFGRPAHFPLGPFELIQRLKIPYVFVFATKENKKHYHFYAFKGSNTFESTESLIQEYIQALEKILTMYPEQWFNYFQFWENE